MTEEDKKRVLRVCRKLEFLKIITAIEEHKYSIQFLIRTHDVRKTEEDDYEVRDRIKKNFEEQGYKVEILGTWWLEVYFIDIGQIIDDCFDDRFSRLIIDTGD